MSAYCSFDTCTRPGAKLATYAGKPQLFCPEHYLEVINYTEPTMTQPALLPPASPAKPPINPYVDRIRAAVAEVAAGVPVAIAARKNLVRAKSVAVEADRQGIPRKRSPRPTGRPHPHGPPSVPATQYDAPPGIVAPLMLPAEVRWEGSVVVVAVLGRLFPIAKVSKPGADSVAVAEMYDWAGSEEHLDIPCRSEAEARVVITKLLAIRGVTL